MAKRLTGRNLRILGGMKLIMKKFFSNQYKAWYQDTRESMLLDQELGIDRRKELNIKEQKTIIYIPRELTQFKNNDNDLKSNINN